MPSHFLGIYTALYDYVPQSDQELALQEGDLLYVLEKSTEDDWWKAKKRSKDSDDEPEGLIPNNYVEEAKPISKCKALYDYTRQTEEELSFSEDTILDVYDSSDPNWTLVGHKGEYGFAPSNYIELTGDDVAQTSGPSPSAPSPNVSTRADTTSSNTRQDSYDDEDEEEEAPPPQPPRVTPTAAPEGRPAMPQNLLASIRNVKKEEHSEEEEPESPPPARAEPPRKAPIQSRPSPPAETRQPERKREQPRSVSFAAQPDYSDSESDDDGPALPVRPPPVIRQQNQKGKRRTNSADFNDDIVPDSPTTIPAGFRAWPVQEVNGRKKHSATLAIGPNRIILIPDKSTLPRQEWKAENIISHSVEDKHVFLDVNFPTKSMDLHAGSKDPAYEIYQTIGELVSAVKASGLNEVINASKSAKASNKYIGTILWDFAATERGEVSVTAGDTVTIIDDTEEDWWLVRRAVNGLQGVVPASYVERGRVEVPQANKSVQKASRERESSMSDSGEVGPGMRLPVRSTSLAAKRHDRQDSTSSQARTSARSSTQKSKPDMSKVRTWTDRSGSYKVEAQFLSVKDGKIQLHKLNGVKIVVPASKMSIEDIEYVERVARISLDEDKPLSAIKRDQQQRERVGLSYQTTPPVGISTPKKEAYDWFDFFLSCGVDVADCQRYAHSFERDRMDESVLPDITPQVMRTLGLKEGDILRVSKFLDKKFRNGESQDEQANSSLFVGAGGALKNNTRKSRPAPAVQTPTTVDPKAFEVKEGESKPATSQAPGANKPATSGFDDDAWTPKPTRQPSPKPQTEEKPASSVAPQTTPAPPVSAGVKELSLLDEPLQPTPAPQPKAPVQQPQPVQPQPTAQPSATFAPQLAISPTQTGTSYSRPQAPAASQNGLIPPPPQRPLSAPQNFTGMTLAPQQPLVPHITGQPAPNRSLAPQGQLSLNDMTQQMQQMRLQQQMLQQQQTGMQGVFSPGLMPQPTGQFGQVQPLQPQMTALQSPAGGAMFMNVPSIQQPQPQPALQQPMVTMQPTGNFMMPNQTGFQPGFPQQQQVPVNSVLPPPLVPQPTSFLSTQQNMSGSLQPLRPQPTGPAPDVRFGVKPEVKKLVPQPTGRANLSKATPENPFGF